MTGRFLTATTSGWHAIVMSLRQDERDSTDRDVTDPFSLSPPSSSKIAIVVGTGEQAGVTSSGRHPPPSFDGLLTSTIGRYSPSSVKLLSSTQARDSHSFSCSSICYQLIKGVVKRFSFSKISTDAYYSTMKDIDRHLSFQFEKHRQTLIISI